MGSGHYGVPMNSVIRLRKKKKPKGHVHNWSAWAKDGSIMVAVCLTKTCKKERRKSINGR